MSDIPLYCSLILEQGVANHRQADQQETGSIQVVVPEEDRKSDHITPNSIRGKPAKVRGVNYAHKQQAHLIVFPDYPVSRHKSNCGKDGTRSV